MFGQTTSHGQHQFAGRVGMSHDTAQVHGPLRQRSGLVESDSSNRGQLFEGRTMSKKNLGL